MIPPAETPFPAPEDLRGRILSRLALHRRELDSLTTSIREEMEKEIDRRSIPMLLVLQREADRRTGLIQEIEREILGEGSAGRRLG